MLKNLSMIRVLKNKLTMVLVVMLSALILVSCASSGKTGYQPKYKKPNPNKPLPCPLKDC
jgi:hypothetical protein